MRLARCRARNAPHTLLRARRSRCTDPTATPAGPNPSSSAPHPVSEQQGAWRHGPVAVRWAACARRRGAPGAALSKELALGVMRSMACWPTSFGPRFCASGLTSETPKTSLILSFRLGGCGRGRGRASATGAASCSKPRGSRGARLRRALLQQLTNALLEPSLKRLAQKPARKKPWRCTLPLFVCTVPRPRAACAPCCRCRARRRRCHSG
jgi:hypothetical protein